MPWWIKIYICCYILTLFLNIYFWTKSGSKFAVLVYEILGGIYLIGFAIAYWNPTVFSYLNIGCVPAIISIFVFDIYISINATKKDFGIHDEDFDDMEVEIAKTVSVVFAAPAYIIASLVSLQIIKNTFQLA